MDVIGILTIAATVAGILSFVNSLFVGQKSIPKWFRDRRTAKDVLKDQKESPPSISIPPRVVQPNLPHHGDSIGREKEKVLVNEALKSRSFTITIEALAASARPVWLWRCCTNVSRRAQIPNLQQTARKNSTLAFGLPRGIENWPSTMFSTPLRGRWNIHLSPNCNSKRNVTRSSSVCRKNHAC